MSVKLNTYDGFVKGERVKRLSPPLTEATFVRVEHFCGGSNLVIKEAGCASYTRIPLMPGEKVSTHVVKL